MTRFPLILIAIIGVFGCTRDKYRNTVLQEVSNAAHNSKAVLFFKDGDVSVLTYNVSILKDNYSLTNGDTANVFSFTNTDTSLTKPADGMIRLVWVGKTELEIIHPIKGTVWKNKSMVNIEGTKYHISYRNE